jgi:hypothetical protein
MPRKIKINTVNEENLEKKIRENILRATQSDKGNEPVDEQGPETDCAENKVYANACPEKEIEHTVDIDNKNDSILGPTIENEFRQPEVIQMRIDANDINKKEDIKACKNFITGFRDTVSKLKESTVIETLKELSPDQLTHIEELAKKIIKFNQRINQIENTKEDIKAARILINQEDSLNKLKHIKDATGELFLSIPEENIDTINNYENVNHPEHYNNYDVEAIEMMERIWGPEETAIFCKLNAFKYRMRMGTKPTSPVEEDIKKEKWYIKKYHELLNKLKIK